MELGPTERRIFITEDEKKYYRLLKVRQGSKEADFYFTWPEIINSKFFLLNTDSRLKILTSSEPGRLSFHASGQAHFAKEGKKAKDEFIIKGNQLFNAEEKKIGMRHLFTYIPKKPSLLPDSSSPAFNRASDHSFLSKNSYPVIIIFFAIPNGYSINLKMHLNENDFNIPADLPGMDIFHMKHHNLYWLAYQQKNMEWPQKNHIAYSDGHSIPLFISKGQKGENEMELIFVKPDYENLEKDVSIKIDQTKKIAMILNEEEAAIGSLDIKY